MDSIKQTACRTAGFWYLLMALGTAFGMAYVDPRILVPGNAEATVNNILTHKFLFDLGFISNVAGLVSFLFLANSLYKLLKPVDKDQARLMVIFIVAGVSIAFINMLNQIAPRLLLSEAGYLSAFEKQQVHAMVMICFKLYQYGGHIAGFFWGLWMFPFGLLAFRSGFIPKVIGLLLMIGCFAYLINSVVLLFFPDYRTITYPGIMIATVGEISAILWFLIKGLKNQKPAPVAINS